MKSRNWTIGESVEVKPDVTDPDTGRDIGGWQGRIGAILDEGEPATARDTRDDVAAVTAELESQTNWLYLGEEQGKRIQAVVNRAKGHNELAVFRAWHAYLE